MKIFLMAIGDKEEPYLTEGYRIYEERLKHYLPSFTSVVIPGLKAGKITKEALMEAEAKEILRKIEPSDLIILLDSKGKTYNSEEFATYIQTLLNKGGKRLIFILGGAYGFAPEIIKRANDTLSFSKLTFNHRLARLIFLEQLYRAMTILKGEKYHH
jgi:23S rRNA (pseudouridine1915-N3)-methyltransferase